MSRFLKAGTWILFAVAALFLTYQTWHAVNGTPVNLTSATSATIVAGMVTATWLIMLGRLMTGMDQTRAEYLTTFVLMIAALGVDVAVAISVITGLTFPPFLALLVIIGHVLAHVTQVVVRSLSDAGQRFSTAYTPPDQQISELERSNALLEQQVQMLEDAHSKLEQQYKRAKAKQERTYEEVCPSCNKVFEKNSKDSAQRALRAHAAHCQDANANGNKGVTRGQPVDIRNQGQ